MYSYYDLVLALIPTTLGGTATIATIFGIDITTGVTFGAAMAALLIGHALFVRSPVNTPSLPDRPQVTADTQSAIQQSSSTTNSQLAD